MSQGRSGEPEAQPRAVAGGWRPPQGALAELVAAAREDCDERRRRRPGLPGELARNRIHPRGFAAALLAARPGFPLIAEVKRASPSAGPIAPGLDATAQARAYERGGARCISVLTEARRFGGALGDLRAVRTAVALPLLRKDFIVHPFMVQEAADAGADAVLLIAGAVPPVLLAELSACARELGLDVLVEVVHPFELESAEAVTGPLLGINARDLESLVVDAGRFARLAPLLARPGRLLVAESGIRTADELRAVASAGAGAVLVGEFLARAPDPEAAVRELVAAR